MLCFIDLFDQNATIKESEEDVEVSETGANNNMEEDSDVVIVQPGTIQHYPAIRLYLSHYVV